MPYDELGNYYHGIDPELMRYATTVKKTEPKEQQELKQRSLQNRSTPAEYARREKVLSEVPDFFYQKPGGMSEMPPPPEPYTTAPSTLGKIIDRSGLTVPAQIATNMAAGYPLALLGAFGAPETAGTLAQYIAPTAKPAKDVLEGLGELAARTGPMPELMFMGKHRTVTPSDVQVLGARGINAARELKAVPHDFSVGRQGVNVLNAFGEPTIGSKLGSFENKIIGEPKRQKLREAASNAPQDVAYNPLRERVAENYEPGMPMYAVRNKGQGEVLFGKNTPYAKASEVSDSYSQLNQVVDDARPIKSANQMNPESLVRKYQTTLGREMQRDLEDFKANRYLQQLGILDADVYDAQNIRNFTQSKEERDAEDFELIKEWSNLPETQVKAEQNGRTIIPFQDYEARVKAANAWLEGPFRKHVQTYLGTAEDPLLEKAAQGLTYRDPEELDRIHDDYVDPADVQATRVANNFPARGVYGTKALETKQMLDKSTTALQTAERERIDLGRRLYEANPDADPAVDPTYAASGNIVDKLKAQVKALEDQYEKLSLAEKFEELSDSSLNKYTRKEVAQHMPLAEQIAFFPNLAKTPDEATMYGLNKYNMAGTGLNDIAEDFVNQIMQGQIPIDQIKNMPLPKFVESVAKPREQAKLAEKLKAQKNAEKFLTYLKDEVAKVPPDKIFGNAVAIEFDSNTPMDEIKRGISTETEILDHCSGQGCSGSRKHFLTGKSRQYEPAFDPVTGEPTKNSSGRTTSYMDDVANGSKKLVSIRDRNSGISTVTLEMKVANSQPREADGVAQEILSQANLVDVDQHLQYLLDNGNFPRTAEGVKFAVDHMLNDGIIDPDLDGINNRELTQREREELQHVKNMMIRMAENENKYNLGFVSGYQNGRIDLKYQAALKDYLNSISDQIKGTGGNLEPNAEIYDSENPESIQRGIDRTNLRSQDIDMHTFDTMPRFITLDDIKSAKFDTPVVNPSAANNYQAVVQEWLGNQRRAIVNWYENHLSQLDSAPQIISELQRYRTNMYGDGMNGAADELGDLQYRLEDFQRGQTQTAAQPAQGELGLVGPAMERIYQLYGPENQSAISLILGQSLPGVNSLRELLRNIRQVGSELAHDFADELERGIQIERENLADQQPAPQDLPTLTRNVFDQLHEHFDRLNGVPPNTQTLRNALEQTRRTVLNHPDAINILNQLPPQARAAMADVFAANAIPHPNERNQPARVNAQPTAQDEFNDALRHLEREYGELSMTDTPEVIARVIRNNPELYRLTEIRPGMRDALLQHIGQFGFDGVAQQPAQQPEITRNQFLGEVLPAFDRVVNQMAPEDETAAGAIFSQALTRSNTPEELIANLRNIGGPVAARITSMLSADLRTPRGENLPHELTLNNAQNEGYSQVLNDLAENLRPSFAESVRNINADFRQNPRSYLYEINRAIEGVEINDPNNVELIRALRRYRELLATSLPEGFKKGGQVKKYQVGGMVSSEPIESPNQPGLIPPTFPQITGADKNKIKDQLFNVNAMNLGNPNYSLGVENIMTNTDAKDFRNPSYSNADNVAAYVNSKDPQNVKVMPRMPQYGDKTITPQLMGHEFQHTQDFLRPQGGMNLYQKMKQEILQQAIEANFQKAKKNYPEYSRLGYYDQTDAPFSERLADFAGYESILPRGQRLVDTPFGKEVFNTPALQNYYHAAVRPMEQKMMPQDEVSPIDLLKMKYELMMRKK